MFYQTVVSDIAKYLEELPIGNPWKNIQDINILVPNLIGLVLVGAAVVFFFLLLMGGIRWVTAGGDKEALAKAQGTITSALIGIVIVFSAWAILNLVEYFFGLTGLTLSCGSMGDPCGADLPSCCKPYICRKEMCIPIRF